jgi:purine-binding chemotaxis protein CheW
MTSLRQANDTAAAAALAARSAGSEGGAQFITFTLGAEEYGVDIMKVREIKGWVETTTIPHAPAYVRGVINLRGIIVPIFDLRSRFGMGLTEPTRMHVVIIVDVDTRTIGLLVDAVSDIIAVEPGSIRPVPELGTGAELCLIDGLIARGDRMVTLVSLDGLFGQGDDRLAAVDVGAPQ